MNFIKVYHSNTSTPYSHIYQAFSFFLQKNTFTRPRTQALHRHMIELGRKEILAKQVDIEADFGAGPWSVVIRCAKITLLAFLGPRVPFFPARQENTSRGQTALHTIHTKASTWFLVRQNGPFTHIPMGDSPLYGLGVNAERSGRGNTGRFESVTRFSPTFSTDQRFDMNFQSLISYACGCCGHYMSFAVIIPIVLSFIPSHVHPKLLVDEA